MMSDNSLKYQLIINCKKIKNIDISSIVATYLFKSMTQFYGETLVLSCVFFFFLITNVLDLNHLYVYSLTKRL